MAPPVTTFHVWVMAPDQTTKETEVGGATDYASAVNVACTAYLYLQNKWQETGRLVIVYDASDVAQAWIGVQY